jgi:hypothetical protein
MSTIHQGDLTSAILVPPPGHDNPLLVLPRQGDCVYWSKDVKQCRKEEYHGITKTGNEYYDHLINQAINVLKSSATSNDYYPEFLPARMRDTWKLIDIASKRLYLRGWIREKFNHQGRFLIASTKNNGADMVAFAIRSDSDVNGKILRKKD